MLYKEESIWVNNSQHYLMTPLSYLASLLYILHAQIFLVCFAFSDQPDPKLSVAILGAMPN